jgi:hypothetical protein
MLRRDSGHVTSQETAGFVRALTEIGLKIKLLGGFHSFPGLPLGLDFFSQIYQEKKSRYPVGWWLEPHPQIRIFSFPS